MITDRIFKAVERVVFISESEIKSKTRRTDVVLARYMVAQLLFRNYFDEYQIGKIINRDRTTVLHAFEEHENLMFSDRDYRKNFNLIHFKINSEIYGAKLTKYCNSIAISKVKPCLTR